MRRTIPWLALVGLALGCSNTSRPDYLVHLVGAENGGTPFGDCPAGDVQVDVQQGTNTVLTTHGTLANGRLGALNVQIPSYGLATTIEVTVTCNGGGTLIGATPRFLPLGYGFVDIVLGHPGTCARLANPQLPVPREALHLVPLHANVIAIGGFEGAAMATKHVQVLDPLTLTFNASALEFPPLTRGTGLCGTAALGEAGGTMIAVVCDSGYNFIYDAAQSVTTRELAFRPRLHAGAGGESAVVGLGSGVVVVGGVTGDLAVDDISWIASTGEVTSGHLRVPRRRPAAVVVARNRLLVAGGQAMGDPLFEIVPLNAAMATQSTTFGPINEVRYAPVIATDASLTYGWVGFGETTPYGTGTLLTTSWQISGCPGMCVATPGPTVMAPRRDVAVVAHHVGVPGTSTNAYETLVIGGEDAGRPPIPTRTIDRITFGATGAVTLDSFGQLSHLGGLSAAGATEIGAGIFLVAGGVDDHMAVQQEIEICFPAALQPITAAATM